MYGNTATLDTVGWGFAGREWDSDAGMYYNRARWYDPQTGRFASEDPIGFASGDTNLYRYAGNSPTNFTDPSGLEEIQFAAENLEGKRKEQVTRPKEPPSVSAMPAPGSWRWAMWKQQRLEHGLMSSEEKREWCQRYMGFWERHFDTLLNPAYGGLSNIDKAALMMAPGLGAPASGVAANARRGGQSAPNAITPRNAHLADKTHPTTGIPFDAHGYPDFSGVATHTVKIQQAGNYAGDFAAANRAAGLPSTPKGYTWHHHQDGTTMQLVPANIHSRTGHTGGMATGGY